MWGLSTQWVDQGCRVLYRTDTLWLQLSRQGAGATWESPGRGSPRTPLPACASLSCISRHLPSCRCASPSRLRGLRCREVSEKGGRVPPLPPPVPQLLTKLLPMVPARPLGVLSPTLRQGDSGDGHAPRLPLFPTSPVSACRARRSHRGSAGRGSTGHLCTWETLRGRRRQGWVGARAGVLISGGTPRTQCGVDRASRDPV